MNADPTAIRVFQQLLGHAEPFRHTELVNALLAAARATKWRRNQPCRSIAEGDRIGCVLSGTVRKYAIRFNGQRQIVDLLMPGDFIGLVPLDPDFSVEAVCDGTLIAIFSPDALAALLAEHAAIADLIRDRTADAIRRRARRDERGALVLPISRYDIADHLGLAVETVSRAMTALKQRGLIALRSPRHVEINDAGELIDG